MSNFRKAEKNDAELAEMEAELAAQDSEEVEEEQPVQEAEETVAEESAPSKEEEESSETAEVEEEKSDEVEADRSGETEFTEEEWNALSDKTRREMIELRKKARRAEELEAKQAEAERLAEVYAPLKEVAEEVKQEAYKEPESKLPWEDSPSQKAGRWALKLTEDINYAEQTYPELNPSSEDYNDELTGEILQDFRTIRKSQPDYRLKDLVDRRMRSIKAAKEEALKKLKSERKKQEDKAKEALPASTSAPKKKVSVKDKIKGAKTVDELQKLEKELGISDRYR